MKRWSSTGFTTPPDSDFISAGLVVDGSGEFPALGDSLGHVVREGSLPEDSKAEEVNLDLSDVPATPN